MAAEEHHDDHGNTISAWFLTLSWIITWVVAAGAIVFGGPLVEWVVIGLGASVFFAIVAGVLKKAGMGRTEPRPTPPTREQWEAERNLAVAE